MAGFFNLPSAECTKKKDQQLLKKASSPVKSVSTTAVTLKGSTKLIDRINAITTVVKSKFAGKEDELELITTEDHLIKYIDKCIENNVISIDTETTGLDPFLDNIVGICIYTPELKSAYIPINHISYITEQKCANQLPIDFLHDQFQRLVDANVKTIWFNAPFDIRFLQNKINVRFTPYFDTSVAAMCLNSDEPKGSGTLKALHKKYCWGDRGEALTFGKLFDNLPFNLIPIDVAYLYAASDAIYTYELYEFQAQYLEPTGQYYQSHHMEGVSNVFFNIEMKSMPTFIDMEQIGVEIDYDHAKEIYDRYHELANKMKQNLEDVCKPYQQLFDDYRRRHPMCKLSDPINYDSPTQLAIIIYDILGLTSPDKRKPRGTGANILKQLDHPIVKAVLDNRSFNKVLSAFIDTLPEKAKLYPDKRIHCSFKQYGAACVVGDTSILTPSGSMPISSIFNGDEESGISYDTDLTIINRNIKPEKASHRIVYRDVDTIKITLDGGYQIEGTPNHPIICKLEDDISDFMKLEDIKLGDIVELPIGYNIFPKTYTDFYCGDFGFLKLDKTLAEFLGIFASIVAFDYLTGTFFASVSHSIIDRFEKLSKKLFGVDVVSNVFLSKFRDIVLFRQIPRSIMMSPRSVICAFMKGYFSSAYVNPESVSAKMSVMFGNNESYNFAKQFLLNIGIVSSGYIKNLVVSIEEDMYEKFLDAVGSVDRSMFDHFAYFDQSDYVIKNDRLYLPVKKIERCRNTVYDLTVPETHSFISNGMISHNTGRVSCKSPNLQQIPSRPFVLSDGTEIDSGHDVRQLFMATPGYILLSCDYSGQEVRVTAHLSQDEKLIQAYRDGKDPYCEIASLAYGVPYEECTEYRADGTFNPDGKKRRGEAKKIVLGKHITAHLH